MTHFLQQAWLTRGWISWLLWPVALLHGGLVKLRRWLYRRGWLASERFPRTVVVVGNVLAGGAGKTPLTIALVQHLMTQGLQVGVVSRGYGRSGSQPLEVQAELPISQTGDEPALIRQITGVPVFVASHRADAVRALLMAYPQTQVVICDDGLQHYALQRNIEIAVFDDRGVGNGFLLPAGPLREPWPERLEQGVNLVLHTGQTPAFDGFHSSRRLAEHAHAADGRQIALATLHGRRLIALAAIANPMAFFSMLKTSGLTLKRTIALPDHHSFCADDLSPYVGQTVLCTEKDAIKIFTLSLPPSITVLAVPLVFLPERAFFEAFDTLLAPLISHLPSNHGHQTA